MTSRAPPISGDHRPPMLSVIVAAYNIEAFIEDCLASILKSTSPDYEVIVVDDGSTDTTAQRIRHFENHPALHVVRRDNGGLGAARNSGIDIARGAYLAFVDGDDWVDGEAVDVWLEAIRISPGTDIFVFDYFDVHEYGMRQRRCTPDFWHARNAAWNKLYSRELIGSQRFDIDILYEDLARVRPWLAMARTIVRIDRGLYYYRNFRSGSIMNSRRIERFFELFTAASRCIERIETSERESTATSIEQRLGADWRRRFYTSDVFVPGIIYWTRQIEDTETRHTYIAQFLDRLPTTHRPSTRRLIAEFGPKIALIAQCYRRGAYRTGDFLLFEMGDYKRRLARRLGRNSGLFGGPRSG